MVQLKGPYRKKFVINAHFVMFIKEPILTLKKGHAGLFL